jgi:hypothetical protein
MKKMILKTALLLAVALALPTSANAIVVWDWSFDGTVYGNEYVGSGQPFGNVPLKGSGTFTTDDRTTYQDGPQQIPYYQITKITGMWNGNSITGLVPVESLDYSNDNKLLEPIALLTYNGVFFTTESSQVYIRNSQYGFLSSDGFGPFTATIAPIPEPETYALMLASLAVVGAAARRRKAK